MPSGRCSSQRSASTSQRWPHAADEPSLLERLGEHHTQPAAEVVVARACLAQLARRLFRWLGRDQVRCHRCQGGQRDGDLVAGELVVGVPPDAFDA